jgi:ribosomal protein S6--L-glutamate ligase
MKKIILLTQYPENPSNQQIVASAYQKNIPLIIEKPLEVVISLNENHRAEFTATGIIPRLGTLHRPYILAALQYFVANGAYSLNPLNTFLSNKWQQLQQLSSKNFLVPESLFTYHIPTMRAFVQKNNPCVFKLLQGSQGRGIFFGDSIGSSLALIDGLTLLQQPFFLQQFIQGDEYRILVLDEKILGAVRKQKHFDEYRANSHQGASVVGCPIDQAMARLAIAACKAVNGVFCGIDCIKNQDGIYLLEVNLSPGFSEIQKQLSIDIAEEILHFLQEKNDESKDLN